MALASVCRNLSTSSSKKYFQRRALICHGRELEGVFLSLQGMRFAVTSKVTAYLKAQDGGRKAGRGKGGRGGRGGVRARLDDLVYVDYPGLKEDADVDFGRAAGIGKLCRMSYLLCSIEAIARVRFILLGRKTSSVYMSKMSKPPSFPVFPRLYRVTSSACLQYLLPPITGAVLGHALYVAGRPRGDECI